MTTKNSRNRTPSREKKLTIKTSNLKSPTVIPNQKSVEKSMRPFLSPTHSTHSEISKKPVFSQQSPRLEVLANNGLITTRNNHQRIHTFHTITSTSSNKEQSHDLREQNANVTSSMNSMQPYPSPRGEDKAKTLSKQKSSQLTLSQSPDKPSAKLHYEKPKLETYQTPLYLQGGLGGGKGTISPKLQESMMTFDNYMMRLSKLTNSKSPLPNYEPTRHSDKSYGLVKGFAVCTNQGLVRNYNEDRVAIVLNILKPSGKTNVDYWPNCSFFGVYDGHGGYKCAEFLRNHLHQYVIRSQFFPSNPQEALREAFEEADAAFLEIAEKDLDEAGNHDRSGSCAIVTLIVDDMCYVANVGDSRAVISQNGGAGRYALTRDHKPCDKLEQKRIQLAGGKIYQNFPLGANGKRLDLDPATNPFKVQIPFRVLPGRLSVSRAFGDIEAKLSKFGGNPNVVISKPEITTVKLTYEHDFIIMGSDGIYDKLENDEIIKEVWARAQARETNNLHELNKLGVEAILRESLLKKSLDNVTVVMISFSGFEDRFNAELNRPYTSRTQSKLSERVRELDGLAIQTERGGNATNSNVHHMNGNRVASPTYKKYGTMDEKKYRSMTNKEFNSIMGSESVRLLGLEASRTPSHSNGHKFPSSKASPRLKERD